MKNHIADVRTKRKPTPNIPEGLMQAKRIQLHIKEQIAAGQKPQTSRPTWVEITPGPTLVRVIRWIE